VPWPTTTPGQTTACAALSPEAFTARRPGFFPSLCATLNHILIIDHFYVDAMLSDTSVPPPQLDEFFSAGEAPLRAEEFDALGWTEETVWAAPTVRSA
jgi:uncharacterized damage-inducible protein DinB